MSERKKDIVKTMLRDRLVRGSYLFGDRISAKQISEESGASRFMVITALNELQAEGFLDITAQVGVSVIRPAVTEIEDFFMIFSRLEGAMAEIAAERRSKDDISQLRWINDRLRDIETNDEDSGERYRTLNLDFHQRIHQAARSPRLAEKQFSHWAMADFFVTQAKDFRLHIPDSALEHDLVVATIERGDGNSARALMEAHIRRLGQDMVQNLEAQRKVPIS